MITNTVTQGESIPQLLEQMRDIFLTMLDRSLGITRTAGTCLYAAFLLSESLVHFAPGCRTQVRGGAGGMDGGCRDKDGLLHGHYWVEVQLPDGQVGIADITGDQFGYPPVVWLLGAGRHDRYVMGDQAMVDDHLADLRTLCEAQACVADA